jgi:hypothetical protein
MRYFMQKCCEAPKLKLTRDERVTYTAKYDARTGEAKIVPFSGVLLGHTFDEDNPHVECLNCGTAQDL